MSWKNILKEESTDLFEFKLYVESNIKKIVLDLPKDRIAAIRNGRFNETALITYIVLESFNTWLRIDKHSKYQKRTPLKIKKIKIDPSLNKPGKETTITIVYSVQKGIHDKSLLFRNKEFSFTFDNEYKKGGD